MGQPKDFGFGAEEQMLAVVEEGAAIFHATRAAAGRAIGLVEAHRVAAASEAYRRGEAGVARAHHRDAPGDVHPFTHVFQAIQSLRSGVRAMRWSSTS